MREKLAETEFLMKEMELTWEEKLKQTENLLAEREKVGVPVGAAPPPPPTSRQCILAQIARTGMWGTVLCRS
jgi:hypothetical protein